ncbi:hypothetical protein NHQ30_011041 [Ciborinia camelliae]|nr:hypothetical protein NHQ30_011041 [Ciborinia camelliae]
MEVSRTSIAASDIRSKTGLLPVMNQFAEIMAPENIDRPVDDPSTSSLSEPVTTTGLENEPTKIIGQDNSLLLTKLPIEVLTKILEIACISDETIQMCPVECVEDQYHSVPRPRCPEIQRYQALRMTCVAFHTIMSNSSILFKDNTFGFCRFKTLDMLKFITSKQRNAIRSMYVNRHQYIRQILHSDDDAEARMQRNGREIKRGYHIIANCHGLRSLTMNIDELANELVLREEIPFVCMEDFSDTEELCNIRGLEEFSFVTTNPEDPERSLDPVNCILVHEFEDEDDYFSSQLGIYEHGTTAELHEKFKQDWYSKLSELEEKGRIL